MIDVAIGFEHAEHVVTSKQSAKREAAIGGKDVTDGLKVLPGHGDSPFLQGRIRYNGRCLGWPFGRKRLIGLPTPRTCYKHV